MTNWRADNSGADGVNGGLYECEEEREIIQRPHVEVR